MPRIWDIFPFFNELDLLECRLAELDESHVYRHVLIEAPTTFQGDPKPLYFAENRERFAPWAGRIIHVVTGKIPGISPWIREAIQREYASEGLKDASPEDIVMLGDVDEIPRGSCVREDMQTETVLSMSAHMFAVDWLHPESWRGTVVAPLKGLKSFQVLRDLRNYWPPQPDSGWHFSFLGGPQAIQDKVNAFSHPELRELVPRWLDEGHLYRDGKTFDGLELSVQQQSVKVDETFPRWVQERKCPQEWFRCLQAIIRLCAGNQAAPADPAWSRVTWRKLPMRRAVLTDGPRTCARGQRTGTCAAGVHVPATMK